VCPGKVHEKSAREKSDRAKQDACRVMRGIENNVEHEACVQQRTRVITTHSPVENTPSDTWEQCTYVSR